MAKDYRRRIIFKNKLNKMHLILECDRYQICLCICTTWLLRPFLELIYQKNYWSSGLVWLLIRSRWLLCKHLLSCLLKIRPSFIVKLFFCIIRSALGLCVLERCIVRCWGLLHSHHSTSGLHVWYAGVAILSGHSRVHSWVESMSWSPTLSGHDWIYIVVFLWFLI